MLSPSATQRSEDLVGIAMPMVTLRSPPPPPPVGDPHHHHHHHDCHSHDKPSRLYQAAAWVGIVAGVIFIVGSILITGMVLGHESNGGYHHHRGDRDNNQMYGPPMMRGGPDRMGGPRWERPSRSDDDGGSRTTAPNTPNPGPGR